ncbi:hypothetical protein LIER_27642 [Lithospermum erythrorhizon]|uniref:Uncharacterized protein n=1 Tax=Lithospermum erythrorhizon TaxID=34254 RepID=A0AAV3RGC8_LITER
MASYSTSLLGKGNENRKSYSRITHRVHVINTPAPAPLSFRAPSTCRVHSKFGELMSASGCFGILGGGLTVQSMTKYPKAWERKLYQFCSILQPKSSIAQTKRDWSAPASRVGQSSPV